MRQTHDTFLRGIQAAGALLVALACAAPLAADGGVTFQDIAAGDQNGITFRRVPSASNAKFDAIKNDPPYDMAKRVDTPIKARGAPGVAIFDYDGDGDLDLYVANGPGAANSLYANQLRQTGQVTFVDMGVAAGVAATDQDTTGVCYGDIDNDGDQDLVALSHNSPNRLFENRGNGTFTEISIASGVGLVDVRSSTGCTMGDVNGDGLLDIVIGNSYDNWDTFRGIFAAFEFNQHNQLLLNTGGNVFADVGAASGIQELAGFPPDAAGSAGLTWAVGLVDFDLDGDVDLFAAEDQGGVPAAKFGGVDRGLLHLFENSGTGSFTDVAPQRGTATYGSWMGLSFGDFNCDGNMDFFATNFGDYQPQGLPAPGEQPSRWFLGGENGIFNDVGIGDMVTNPFGWGTSTFDYDNDGDLDVVYHGGHDVGPGIDAANGGVILANPDCSAEFYWDAAAVAGSTNHNRRTVHGLAVGDLDDNGFPDVVTVANLDIPEEIPLMPYRPLGSPFDVSAFFVNNFDLDPMSGQPVWNGNVYDNGTLAVELNSGGNGNNWVKVKLVGTSGITARGRSNRDGIGAVVRFTPQGGKPVLKPVVGGASYGSQDALTLTFGLGDAPKGRLEVMWPGGLHNRLYNVNAGEHIVFPEIPCGYDDPGNTYRQYLGCVVASLEESLEAGLISRGERIRLMMSALRAWSSQFGPSCSVFGLSGEADELDG